VPYNTYRTRTQSIIIACIGDAFFKQLLTVLHSPELRAERYLRQPERLADKERIDQVIEQELLTGDAGDWLARLRAARIPCAPVNDFAQALDDAQVRARHMVVDVMLQSGEVVKMPGNPIKLSASEEPAFSAPPLLGEHTDAVLREVLRYSSDQVAALRQTGVIQ
jgi:crotonobetainyl-CoA:carnitine CoA-transferase CaiB-like acyl-CoA transferase